MPILCGTRPTEEQIDAFLGAFEAGTLAKEEFTHVGHLIAGSSYVHRMGEAAALEHMRLCVPRFNESVGGRNTETSGYHETITVFWIKLLAELWAVNPEMSRAAFATLAVETYGERRDVFRGYYDFDVVGSKEARKVWIAPTSKPLGTANL